MGQPINLIAQMAMDDFYTNFRAASEFYTLEDFIARIANVLKDAFQQEYNQLRAENRADKKDEIIGFDTSWLNEQVLKVENKDGERFAVLDKPVMSFAFDKQTAGIQYVFSTQPKPETELERLGLSEAWQQKYVPFSNTIFFIPFKDRIRIIKQGNCNVTSIKVLYIPAIAEDMIIPDGLIQYALTGTIQYMKGAKDGVIIKKSLDGNENKILQTEMNTKSIPKQ